MPLQQSLLLMAMKDSAQAVQNRQATRDAGSASRRLILISQLAAWSNAADARLESTLPLGLFVGFPALQLPDDVRARLARSFSREPGDWRRGARVMVICETGPPETVFIRRDGQNLPRSSCRIIDAALMTVSPRYIPLDSRYEGMVEACLWQEKRAFIKPLRYDGEENVLPDFVLTDAAGAEALPMEVFGMNTSIGSVNRLKRWRMTQSTGPDDGGSGMPQQTLKAMLYRPFRPAEHGLMQATPRLASYTDILSNGYALCGRQRRYRFTS